MTLFLSSYIIAIALLSGLFKKKISCVVVGDVKRRHETRHLASLIVSVEPYGSLMCARYSALITRCRGSLRLLLLI